MIEVTCDAHDGAPIHIRYLTRANTESGWSLTTEETSQSRRDWVNGDELLTAEEDAHDAMKQLARTAGNLEGVRARYRFRCPRCRLSCQARAETLGPVLDVLEEHGVSQISVRSLRLRFNES